MGLNETAETQQTVIPQVREQIHNPRAEKKSLSLNNNTSL
jgi:hypothetical protein